MKRVCVYCGSSPGKSDRYREAARALGHELVARGLDLVYGGASVGVMGAVADAVLERGGEVTGVIPHALSTKEVAHHRLTDLIALVLLSTLVVAAAAADRGGASQKWLLLPRGQWGPGGGWGRPCRRTA